MTGSADSRSDDYIARAERHAGRSLTCRDDVALLLRAGADPALAADFGQALFLAKFWERAMGIIRRTGPGAQDVQKLAGELADATSRISSLLTALVRAVAPDDAEEFRAKYFSMDTGSLGRLGGLLSDLALLKNYELHAGADR